MVPSMMEHRARCAALFVFCRLQGWHDNLYGGSAQTLGPVNLMVEDCQVSSFTEALSTSNDATLPSSLLILLQTRSLNNCVRWEDMVIVEGLGPCETKHPLQASTGTWAVPGGAYQGCLVLLLCSLGSGRTEHWVPSAQSMLPAAPQLSLLNAMDCNTFTVYTKFSAPT